MIRELILQMKLGHVHRAYFQTKFGVDIRQRFAGPLDKLQDGGFLRWIRTTCGSIATGCCRSTGCCTTFSCPSTATRAMREDGR